MCFWRAPSLPPMMQFVQSPNAWSLHSTTSCYLCRWCSSLLCSLRTPRAFTRPGFSWQARTVPPIPQLVQSPNASDLYSIRVLLAGTNYAADNKACAVSERLGPLLDPGSPGRHELCRRCCSLRTCRIHARPVFNWHTRTVSPMLQLVQN